ncbi:hypothetical protein [Nocardioides aquiterrae]|uniref:ESX secretion-associated protein EspG n=1 Tax=Nocardioides aquiterrae TaxID=203799 RepID=A0ABN1UC40_9ACTN
MLVELTAEADLLRTDGAGFGALLAAHSSPPDSLQDAAPDVRSVLTAMAGGPLDRALAVAAAPLVSFVLTVAGPDTRLVHRAWLNGSGCALLLGVHEDLFQLVPHDPAFLTAALVRLARLRPRRRSAEPTSAPADDGTVRALLAPDPGTRRVALDRLDAGYAWQLRGPDGATLTVVDGRSGVRVHVPETGTFEPTTSTAIYRVLSTVVPPPGQA